MIWAALPAPLRRALVLAGLVALGVVAVHTGIEAFGQRAVERDRAARELEQAKEVIRLQEGIRDADVGTGDPDDDTRWLCERAGAGTPCP